MKNSVNSPHPSGGRLALWRGGSMVLLSAGLLMIPAATPLLVTRAAQQPATTSSIPDAKCVIGCENVKPNAKGALSVLPSGLEFTSGKKKAGIATASILDIFTGNQSRQDVTGAGKVVTMGIPYGGGRLVSLFSHKVEVLTVEYADSNGGFHGAVFVLPEGQATSFKNQLVAQGAKASAHVEPPPPEGQKP